MRALSHVVPVLGNEAKIMSVGERLVLILNSCGSFYNLRHEPETFPLNDICIWPP